MQKDEHGRVHYVGSILVSTVIMGSLTLFPALASQKVELFLSLLQCLNLFELFRHALGIP